MVGCNVLETGSVVVTTNFIGRVVSLLTRKDVHVGAGSQREGGGCRAAAVGSKGDRPDRSPPVIVRRQVTFAGTTTACFAAGAGETLGRDRQHLSCPAG